MTGDYKVEIEDAWSRGYDEGARVERERILTHLREIPCTVEGRDERWCSTCSLLDDIIAEVEALPTALRAERGTR